MESFAFAEGARLDSTIVITSGQAKSVGSIAPGVWRVRFGSAIGFQLEQGEPLGAGAPRRPQAGDGATRITGERLYLERR